MPFQNENNRQAGLIVVIQDITEHVKLDNMRKSRLVELWNESFGDTYPVEAYDKKNRSIKIERFVI